MTAPVQNRVLVADPQTGEKVTVAHYLREDSDILSAALDPAFRHVIRPCGPIRKRQRERPPGDLLTRLASGDLEAAGLPPKPAGTDFACIVRESLPPTVELWAEPPEVNVGEKSNLNWSVGNCTSCWASDGPWEGTWGCTGAAEVGPFDEPGDYTFSLTCEGPGGSVEELVTVKVREAPKPIVKLEASPPRVYVNGFTTLYWSASNCISCEASGGWGWQGTLLCTEGEEGTTTIGPFTEEGLYTFSLKCKGPGGSATAEDEVEVLGGSDLEGGTVVTSHGDGGTTGFGGRPLGSGEGMIVLRHRASAVPDDPGQGFINAVKDMVFPALNPERTVVERAEK